ncbi:LytTR family transcriptional regulator DNA-binding domain-containing protein [Paenibacillus sp. BR2-3]
MLKAFIVDDEPLARDELAYILRRSRQVEIVGEADCINDAMKHIEELRPDVVFLDIKLAEDSGLHLAEQLMELDYVPAVVFATAFDEYALQAFDLNALDYVLKPFDDRRILHTLEKIRRLKKNEATIALPQPRRSPLTQKIAIPLDERILMVDLQEILFISSEEGKTLIKTEQKEYKSGEPLTHLERKLQNSHFVRVHRSYMVNVSHIAEIQPWFNSTYLLVMQDGSKVPVSRSYVKELKVLLGF